MCDAVLFGDMVVKVLALCSVVGDVYMKLYLLWLADEGMVML